VELNGYKIRPCTDKANAIGVISSTPTVVGNSDGGTGDEWVNKYEKDVWGNYIMESYSYEETIGIDNNGAPVVRTVNTVRKKLNPLYNPDVVYIPREQRPEWNVVGLLGQIRVLKNQPIPDRWIWLKDLSSEVALYLVR
jgi:hypothetical protein